MHSKKRVLFVLGREPIGGVGTFIQNVISSTHEISCDFIISKSNIESDFHKEVKNKGCNVFWAPELSMNKMYSYKKWLNTFYKKYHTKYDIVHVNTPVVAFFNLYLAKKFNIPVRIYHAHNTRHPNGIKNFRNLVQVKLSIRYATDLFAAGDAAGKFNFGNLPFKVVKNGIRTKKFCFNAIDRKNMRYDLNLAGKFVILQVGSVDNRKNQKLIITALNDLKKSGFNMKNILYLIIGSGPEIKNLKSMIRSEGLSDSVVFLGKILDDVCKYYSASDLLVMPSVSEGLPLTAIEGQCNGIDMLLSESIDTSVKINKNVEFLSITDPTFWERKIQLYCSKHLEKAERESAYQLVQKEGYDIEDSVKDLLRFYDESLKNRNENESI